MTPKTSAMVSAAGLVLMGWLILSADEAPSTGLAILQYAAIAACLVGLAGALVKMRRGG